MWMVTTPSMCIWRASAVYSGLGFESLIALSEFGIASLADACDTPRHLLMFHLFTDVSIFLGLVFAASVLEAACPVSFRRPAFALVAAVFAIFVALILKSEVFPAAGPL